MRLQWIVTALILATSLAPPTFAGLVGVTGRALAAAPVDTMQPVTRRQPTAPEVAGGASEYVYDALGRRIAETIDGQMTRYVYGAGIEVLEERASDAVLLAHYTYGDGIDQPLRMERDGAMYTYHRDAQGSITAVSDSSGNLVEQYAYDAHGEPAVYDATGTPLAGTAVGNPYLFTGRRYDVETGTYYYRARSYDPALGRFIQTDPIGYSAGTLNLYRYVQDNPVRYVDPLGLEEDSLISFLERSLKTFIKKTVTKTGTAGGYKRFIAPSSLSGKFASKTAGVGTGLALTLLSEEGVEAGRGITQIYRHRQLERELVGDIRPYNPFRDPGLQIPDPELRRRPPRPAPPKPAPPEPPCEKPPPFESLSRPEQIAFLERELRAEENRTRRLFRQGADGEALQDSLEQQEQLSEKLERLLVDELRAAEVQLYRAKKQDAGLETVNEAQRKRDEVLERVKQVEQIGRFFER